MDDINLVPIYPGSGPPDNHLDERLRFENVCDNIRNPAPTMVELGCFWAIWTIIFGKRFPNANLIILEANPDKLAVGLTNLTMNGLSATAHFNAINSDASMSKSEFGDLVQNITLDSVFKLNKLNEIDLLHLDIQGSELGVHKDIISALKKGLIHNTIIATHSTMIHEILLKDFELISDRFDIEDLPYQQGIGDGEIIIKRRYF